MPRISLKQYIPTTFTGDRKVMTRFFTAFILFIIISITLSLTTFAQEDKSVTLVVNGEGKTADDANQSALRNAIEQAFGTFISSKTDILNDELIKDEIVSVSNGNIQNFEILSEGQLPDGSYYNTLKATVSVSKLTSFCESKGISVEFKGALFSFNIKQQLLNEENELKAIQDMSVMLKTIIDKSFDFKIDASSPTSINGNNDFWKVPIKIGVSANNNFFKIPQILCKTLSGLSLSNKEVENYNSLNKSFYTILIATLENEDGQVYFLRNKNSLGVLYGIVDYLKNPILAAKISNGIKNFSILDFENFIDEPKNYKLKKIYNLEFEDSKFRPVLDFSDGYAYQATLFHRNYFILFGMAPDSRVSLHIYSDKRYNYIYDLVDDIQINGIDYTKVSTLVYLFMSFLEIEKNDYDLIRISFNDIRTLEEINKITEYKIIPGTNDISPEQINKNNNQTDSDKHLKFNEKEFVENPDKLPIIENQLEFQRNINSQIPEVYKRSGIYEKVNSIVFIDEKGKVQDVQIPKENKIPICDEITKNVLMKTKFEPGLLKGVPVKVKMKVLVEFEQ
jgi:hypothetical protein